MNQREEVSANSLFAEERRVELVEISRDYYLEALTTMFGRVLSDNELADCVGAPGGSMLYINQMSSPLGGFKLAINVKHPLISLMWRWLAYRPAGTTNAGLHVVNQDFYLFKTGDGLGVRLFARQVETLTTLGVQSIKARCLGGPNRPENGSYTWAVLGYNSMIPSLSAQRPLALSSSKTLNELMFQPGGQTWWKQNHTAFMGTFDLSPDSDSQRLLKNYLALKGFKSIHLPTSEERAYILAQQGRGGQTWERLLKEQYHAPKV